MSSAVLTHKMFLSDGVRSLKDKHPLFAKRRGGNYRCWRQDVTPRLETTPWAAGWPLAAPSEQVLWPALPDLSRENLGRVLFPGKCSLTPESLDSSPAKWS